MGTPKASLGEKREEEGEAETSLNTEKERQKPCSIKSLEAAVLVLKINITHENQQLERVDGQS